MQNKVPVDKIANRPFRNFVSAVAMLGHLCSLYDRGIFESARLMSNLLHQLAVKRKSNSPLLEQIGADNIMIVVDVETLSSKLPANPTTSPLASVLFGLKKDHAGALRPVAHWVPTVYKLTPLIGFASLTIEEWLDDPIIPTKDKTLSRGELIGFVRDQDGGAHSDPDTKLLKSTNYLDLVNHFPISKLSFVDNNGKQALAWELLPPVTHPMLRQIAHEMLSAIFSQTNIQSMINPPPTVICLFDGNELKGVFAPPGYQSLGKVYGRDPEVVPFPG